MTSSNDSPLEGLSLTPRQKPLYRVYQLKAHVHTAGLTVFRRGDPFPDDITLDFDEPPVKVYVASFKADQLSLSHARPGRTQEEWVIMGHPIFDRL